MDVVNRFIIIEDKNPHLTKTCWGMWNVECAEVVGDGGRLLNRAERVEFYTVKT